MTSAVLAPLLAQLPANVRPAIEHFLTAALDVFDQLDCSLLEMNPFTLSADGQVGAAVPACWSGPRVPILAWVLLVQIGMRLIALVSNGANNRYSCCLYPRISS